MSDSCGYRYTIVSTTNKEMVLRVNAIPFALENGIRIISQIFTAQSSTSEIGFSKAYRQTLSGRTYVEPGLGSTLPVEWSYGNCNKICKEKRRKLN